MEQRLKDQILNQVDRLEAALEPRRNEEAIGKILYQCDRLRHAVSCAHSEGVRFATFTIGRLIGSPAVGPSEAALTALEGIKKTLEEQGYRLSH